MTGTFTIDGGDATGTVAKTDVQAQIDIAPPVFSSGTWTVTETSEVILVTRTPAGTTDLYTMPITVPSRTTALKGMKLNSVKIVATLGGTSDLTNDNFEIDIYKVTTPADASAPTGTVIGGAAVDADYDSSHNTKAKRLALATHTVTVSVHTPVYMAAGEQYYCRLRVFDNSGTDLTFILKGAMAQFDMIPL